MSKANVLFLCMGNSARSQMAEAFLRHYASDDFEAYSAGVEPKGLNPLTVQVMQEIGLDMSQAHSKDMREYLGRKNFGYLVVVCSDAEEKCPVIFVNVRQRLYWPFEDPARFHGDPEQKLAKFREVRDQIAARIRAWLTELNLPVAAAAYDPGAVARS
jgi:arsenate reductase